MSLNPQYVLAPSLQEIFLDKDTGLPLSGGKIYYYSDNNRTMAKNVYAISGNAADYTFVPLPNPVILSAIGTIQDNNGNDIKPYYFPFVSEEDNTQELYFIVVQSSLGVPQFTREAWPGSQSGSGSSNAETTNYVPNGQFLAHIDLPDNELLPDTNIIAQGGFTIELSSVLTSINTLTFQKIAPTQNPGSSPRNVAVLNCSSPTGTETTRIIRIKWQDVNKFSSDPTAFYTFGFFSQSNVTMPATLSIYRNFGTNGSTPERDSLRSFTISTSPVFQKFAFQFPSNNGESVDLINNDDFVAIDIELSTTIGFILGVTDFVLAPGSLENTLLSFPVQTNADMITRSIAGWLDNPAADGSDLYLPVVNTIYGQTADHGQVGKIEASIFSVINPSSVIPRPITNDMLCDGSSYLYNNYSTLTIPFSRLGLKLISDSPVLNVPKFGTGLDYATAYIENGSADIFRMTVNSLGIGISYAADGLVNPTNWIFTGGVVFDGSMTGSNSIPYVAYNNIANTVLQVATFLDVPVTPATAGTSPFTINEFFTSYTTGTGGGGSVTTRILSVDRLLAQQKYWITILCTNGASLVTGGAGFYWRFSDTSPLNYYMWFNTGTETDPAPFVGFGIQINIDASFSAQDVANSVREALNNLQSTIIDITTWPAATTLVPGANWTFQTNPSSVRNFYVWYTIDGIGIDPMVAFHTPLKVELLSTDTAALVRNKTQIIINSYQYSVPDFRGMTLRGLDTAGTWDIDVEQRWSTVTGISGANVGTFEFSQILSHEHVVPYWTGNGTAGAILSGYNQDFVASRSQVSNNTGGSETRSVNAAVNWVIKY